MTVCRDHNRRTTVIRQELASIALAFFVIGFSSGLATHGYMQNYIMDYKVEAK